LPISIEINLIKAELLHSKEILDSLGELEEDTDELAKEDHFDKL
jgi:hypothetical protein